MIYALLDAQWLRRSGLDIAEAARAIESLQVPIAQYRNKEADTATLRRDLETIRRYFHGQLIINDHPELIDVADGVHLGQEDLAWIDPDPMQAVETIRRMIGEKILGLSTHNAAEIAVANALDLDYIGLGAYRSTGTKKDAVVQGEALLEIARASLHPVAIIGGVRMEDHFDPPIYYRVMGSALCEKITQDVR